ncbi:MAG: hypothetical protein ACYC9Y_15235 [Candidatus Methylomirabilia bacterium]
MKTWISHALAVPAFLASCFGFVSPAGAQVAAVSMTVDPPAVTVNLLSTPSFEVTYKTKDYVSLCSLRGGFYTNAIKDGSIELGVIPLSAKIPAARRNTLELVTIQPAVVAEIRRRRVTKPIFYIREWVDCDTRKFIAFTDVEITHSSFSVEAVQGTARVASANDTLVPVRWRAIFGDGVISRVESREGRFVDGQGRAYGSTVRDLLQASGKSPLEFNETLRVPESVVKVVLAGGASGIRFERTFSIEGVQVTAAVQLQFASRIASPFSIDRAELRFLDGSRFKTVPLGEEVQVAADITFSGSGRLQGAWKLAEPTTTSGAPIFVRMQLLDEYLSFGRRVVFNSPPIKADQEGTYIVQLEITSPNLGEEGTLELRYVVRATGEAVKIALELPPPLARLSPGLHFTWGAVAGAKNYLLEFYEVPSAEGREPAAGMVLPGGASRAVLSQTTERNFQPGRTYWWRVVALGPDGVLLGQSALRELLTPQE